MDYMLMFYEPQAQFTAREDAVASQGYWAGWMAYVQSVHESGVFKSGEGLQAPPTATTVRLAGSKRQVQDGPFADAKEQLAGYFVISVPNLDAALEWAARAPCAATGGVEVRPVLPPPPTAA